MPQYTDNYGLIKPYETENYDVEVQNSNMDKIDLLIKTAEDKINVLDNKLEKHKEDYAQQRQQGQLKIAKVEKELNDYKATMQQVNINQEPKQKATGYGVISLPPNAAEGQVSGVVRGQTLTNYYNHDNLRFTTGDVLSEKLETGFKLVKQSDSIRFANNTLVNLKAGTYTLVCYVKENTTVRYNSLEVIYQDSSFAYPQIFGGGYVGYYKRAFTFNKDVQQIRFYIHADEEDGVGYTLENILFLEGDWTNKEVPATYITGTKSTFGAGRVQSTDDKGNVISELYYIAKDEEGNIVELRSLPNGTKDEISFIDNKLIKRVSDEIVVDNSFNWVLETQRQNVDSVLIENVIEDNYNMTANDNNFARISLGWSQRESHGTAVNVEIPETDIYKFAVTTAGSLRLIVPKGKYATLEDAKADLAGLTLIYQLAEPIEMPVQVSGTLTSYPNGTVYIEPFVADAGVYTDKIKVLHQDLPIKEIEQLSKVDFMTGVEIPLDVSKVKIDENGLSFTHSELEAGDIVFFTYEYDREGTQGETEIEYYDSRYVVKDTQTDKFYKWNIVVANGQPSIELVEV